MSVLIITRSDDNSSIKLVSNAIADLGEEAIRLNSDLYPQEIQLSTTYSSEAQNRVLTTPDGRYDLSSLKSIWYRRFAAGSQLPDTLGDTRDASIKESKSTLYGSIASMNCFELDTLKNVRGADHKELQLKRALELGLDIPKTLFSNDPEEVKNFYQALNGRMVTKMQSSFAIYRENVENVVFTTVVTQEHLNQLEGLRWCPMTFQEHLDKRIELRATVVGDKVFTASIDSQKLKAAQTDWRVEGEALIKDWEPFELPSEIQDKLIQLVRSFGLNYAAADFVVTPDDRYVFLEINAAGEWFWLQHSPGLPIAEAIANLLVNH